LKEEEEREKNCEGEGEGSDLSRRRNGRQMVRTTNTASEERIRKARGSRK
jgi:hypothetical protein